MDSQGSVRYQGTPVPNIYLQQRPHAWGGNNLLMTSNKFLKINSLLDFCLFDYCHLSPRLRIQWRRWDSKSLGYLDSIFYLKREISLGEREIDEPREARERCSRQFFCVCSFVSLWAFFDCNHYYYWRLMRVVISDFKSFVNISSYLNILQIWGSKVANDLWIPKQ